MPAGTIALTNNSTAVTGSGTSFTSELKANDFIVAIVGGVTYTLGVQSVGSATSLTLTTAYNGPTMSGASWAAVPNAALVGITAQVAADVAKAIRGLNMDKANWQQVFSATGNITVNLPDGSAFTGPSWNYMANQFANKLDKSGGIMTGAVTVPGVEVTGSTPYIDFHYNNSATDFNVRLINSADKALNIFGEGGAAVAIGVTGSLTATTGISSVGGGVSTKGASPAATPPAGTETASGIFEAGYNTGVYSGVRSLFHTNVVQGSGTSAIIAIQTSVGGAYTRYQFTQSGNAVAPGTWVSNSDERLKTNIERISDPLEKMKMLKGVTWERVDGVAPGIGFIAQDVQSIFPNHVFNTGDRTLKDGTIVEGVLSPDTSGVAAALHHEALLVLMGRLEEMEKRDKEKDTVISELQARMKTIDGLEA